MLVLMMANCVGSKWYRPLCAASYHEILFVVVEGVLVSPLMEDVVGTRIGNIAATQQSHYPLNGARSVTGAFSSSNDLLNRLYNTSIWTMQTQNLVAGGMSVDCPHRERLGYLGDVHSTLETALQNVVSGPFYSRWLTDMMDIQGYPAHTTGLDPSGYIPHTVPKEQNNMLSVAKQGTGG